MKKAITLAVLLLLAVPAAAQDARFQMEVTDGTIIRLDKQTGQVSMCRTEEGKIVCDPATDEALATEAEIDALRVRVMELENRIAALEAAAPASQAEGLPSDEEFERSLGFMERFFRRFMGIIREFEQEQAGPDQPDRT